MSKKKDAKKAKKDYRVDIPIPFTKKRLAVEGGNRPVVLFLSGGIVDLGGVAYVLRHTMKETSWIFCALGFGVCLLFSAAFLFALLWAVADSRHI